MAPAQCRHPNASPSGTQPEYMSRIPPFVRRTPSAGGEPAAKKMKMMSTMNWYSAWPGHIDRGQTPSQQNGDKGTTNHPPRIDRHMGRVRIAAFFGKGGRSRISDLGSSVASASEAKESMIMFTCCADHAF